MNKFLKHITVALCLAAVFAPAFARQTASTSEDNRKKARYIFLEAIAKNSEEDTDASFNLLKLAHETDPENTTISYYYGFSVVSQNNPTPDELAEGLELMKENTVLRPDDFYENYIYAILCSQLSDYDETIRVIEILLQKYPDKTQMYPVLAKSYAAKGDFRKAVAVTDSLEKAEGRSVSSTIMKVSYLFNTSDTAAIIGAGQQFLGDAPGSAEPNALMGNIYAQLGKADSAFVYYDKALAIDPDYGFVNLQKANLYNSIGDSLNYEREISTVLLNKNIEVDTKIDILSDYIRTYIQQNDSSARVDNMFRTILEQHAHEAKIRSLYSEYLSFKEKYADAAEQLSYALDIDPSDPKNWERLMWLYMYTAQPEKTVRTGEKALHYNPENIAYYQILGSAYYQLEDYGKSLECYDTLLAKNKAYKTVDESDVYTLMAESHHKKGDKEKAYECFEKALALNPGNALALNNYAYFLCTEKPEQLDKAERMSRAAVDAAPENSSSLDTYAWIMFLKHDYKTALEYIEKAVESRKDNTDDSELWEHYGDILFMLGRPDEAVEKWKKSLKGNPESKLLKKKIENKTYFYE